MSSVSFKISPDSDPSSPRENDNVGTMVCWHRRYTLGDEQPKQDPVDFENALPKDTVILPLYLYDHSGLTMSTEPFSCPWDSGQVGFIYATPKKLKAEYGKDWKSEETMETIRNVLKAEVAEYDTFLRGDFWVMEKLENGEVVECLVGFAGSDPFENGMSENVEESDYPALAQAAEEAGLNHSFGSTRRSAKMR